MNVSVKNGARSVRAVVGCAAAVAALVVPVVGLPALAHADAAATVKSKTQRMSAATLQSRQDGWYDAGSRLTLVCSTRGQAVKGFFGPYIAGSPMFRA